MPHRELDVIVYGATGFTGRLVAEHLHEHHGASGLRWAVAGRSEAKLERVRTHLASRGDAALPDAVVADSTDPASLRAMCARATTIITTVGPYARYGTPLVEAAIAEGTHTCDLTGEPQWVRRLIDEHHDDARDAGVRIVNSCGFDAIPSDLGCLVLQHTAMERHDAPCPEVESVLWAASGGYSGGTAASMFQMFDEADDDPAVWEAIRDPYALDPGGQGTSDTRELTVPRRSDFGAEWVAPWAMAVINEKIVRRSNAVLGYPWGRDLSYQEVVRTGRGVGGALRAWTMAAGLGAGWTAGRVRLLRRLGAKIVREPGEGPSREERESGFLRMEQFGDADGDPAKRVQVTVRAHKDPGYGATAIMLGEAGLCLALDGARLPDTAGILTAASGMGLPLVERLNRAGVTFTPAEPDP